ncbi:MAG: S41 family peptidase [Armatimonadetes bacterium]|nr:S41 family peptidase [Armatimonadota bacterium]
MQTIHKLGIGILIGVSFATGFTLRHNAIEMDRGQIAASSRQNATLASGNRIAALGLEGAGNDFRPIQTLYVILMSLREHYVEQLTTKNEREMTYDALKVMLASLNDTDTRFVEPDEMRAIADAREGKFHGIGAVLRIKRITANKMTDEHLVIASPIANGPAAAAKLQPGDIVNSIDGKMVLPFDPFQKANKIIKDSRILKTPRSQLRKTLDSEQKRIEGGISIVEAQKMLTTGDGKTVELSISRQGSKAEIKVKIEGREFTIEPIESKLIENSKYGYVKINYFGKNTAEQFAKAIADLKAGNANGLVLDLRNVSGGDTQAALDVAKYLVPGKALGVMLQSRNRKSSLMIASAPKKDEWTGPIVVLTNAGTARTPEVLASALKNNVRAKLVGVNTNGDSVSTTLYTQKDGSAIVIRTGKFITNKNEDFTGKGIPVDLRIVGGTSNDTQLEGAAKLLASMGSGS